MKKKKHMYYLHGKILATKLDFDTWKDHIRVVS